MENYARLKVITNKYSIEQLNEVTGLKADKFFRAGDFKPNTTLLVEKNIWIINSGLESEKSLEEHILALINKLEPHAKFISNLKDKDTDLEFSCVCYYSIEPPLYFDLKIISKISELNAHLDIDLYNLQ